MSVCLSDRQALVTRLGSIFAPGIASILHSNYTISMDFLRSAPQRHPCLLVFI